MSSFVFEAEATISIDLTSRLDALDISNYRGTMVVCRLEPDETGELEATWDTVLVWSSYSCDFWQVRQSGLVTAFALWHEPHSETAPPGVSALCIKHGDVSYPGTKSLSPLEVRKKAT